MKIISNFLAIALLVALIATPLYFANNFAKVAGVKSESKYLVVSQIDKFPNLTLSQNGEDYKITFTKFGPSQAFLGILIINNPTDQTQNYKIENKSTNNKIFFGDNIDSQKTEINVPSQASITVSLISTKESTDQSQEVNFTIVAN